MTFLRAIMLDQHDEPSKRLFAPEIVPIVWGDPFIDPRQLGLAQRSHRLCPANQIASPPEKLRPGMGTPTISW
jgi:hypothetical protein